MKYYDPKSYSDEETDGEPAPLKLETGYSTVSTLASCEKRSDLFHFIRFQNTPREKVQQTPPIVKVKQISLAELIELEKSIRLKAIAKAESKNVSLNTLKIIDALVKGARFLSLSILVPLHYALILGPKIAFQTLSALIDPLFLKLKACYPKNLIGRFKKSYAALKSFKLFNFNQEEKRIDEAGEKKWPFLQLLKSSLIGLKTPFTALKEAYKAARSKFEEIFSPLKAIKKAFFKFKIHTSESINALKIVWSNKLKAVQSLIFTPFKKIAFHIHQLLDALRPSNIVKNLWGRFKENMKKSFALPLTKIRTQIEKAQNALKVTYEETIKKLSHLLASFKKLAVPAQNPFKRQNSNTIRFATASFQILAKIKHNFFAFFSLPKKFFNGAKKFFVVFRQTIEHGLDKDFDFMPKQFISELPPRVQLFAKPFFSVLFSLIGFVINSLKAVVKFLMKAVNLIKAARQNSTFYLKTAIQKVKLFSKLTKDLIKEAVKTIAAPLLKMLELQARFFKALFVKIDTAFFWTGLFFELWWVCLRQHFSVDRH